jgi:non-ribosomal peptide synthase protein (TIGR01720 family)
LIHLEGHGREDLFESLDLSRTVGWFTTLFPVALRLTSDDPGEALMAIKEQLRAIPKRGIGYGVLRAAGNVRAARADLGFNYLGQVETTPGGGETGPMVAPSYRREHKLEVLGRVESGKLRVTWTYSPSVHRPATIESLALRYRQELAALIEHCVASETSRFTVSDFPEASFTAGELDALMARYSSDPGDAP